MVRSTCSRRGSRVSLSIYMVFHKHLSPQAQEVQCLLKIAKSTRHTSDSTYIQVGKILMLWNNPHLHYEYVLLLLVNKKLTGQ